MAAERPGWVNRLPALGWLVLVALMAHLAVNTARIDRLPAPVRTFHNYDVLLVRYPLVLRGDAKAETLPLDRLVPVDAEGFDAADMVAAAFKTSEQFRNSYRNTAPVYYLLVSLPAVLLGVSPWTVRIGPVLALALLALAVRGVGRKLISDEVGTWAAVIVTLIPAVFQSTWIGGPFLGNMLAVALILWALARSEMFRRPHWALAVGVFVATGIRWGESASEGLLVLVSVAGPLVIAVLVALYRVRRHPWALLGVALAAGVAWQLGDWPWLMRFGSGRVAEEASVSLSAFASNIRVYPDALFYSVLGPMVSALTWLTVPLVVWRVRPVWKVAWLLSSPAGLLVALTLSDKGNDYYTVALLPALAVILAAGVVSLPRLGRPAAVLATGLLASSWLTIAHLDKATRDSVVCQPVVAAIFAGDPLACEPKAPETAVDQWYRRWRRLTVSQRGRHRVARWLLSAGGQRKLEQIEAGAGLVVVRSAYAEADIVELIVQASRPDVIVVHAAPELPNEQTRRLLRLFDTLYFATVAQFTHVNRQRVADMPGWVSSQDTILLTEELHIVRVRGQ